VIDWIAVDSDLAHISNRIREIGEPIMAIASKRKAPNLEIYRARLMQERAELVKRLYERRSQLAMEHEVDDEGAFAIENSLKDFALTNMEREVRTLAEVELSLRLLDNGQYGWCGGCGAEIPVARLKALPWTRTCVHCAGGAINRSNPSIYGSGISEHDEVRE
jgi:RNA polymerase-binding protein DksA